MKLDVTKDTLIGDVLNADRTTAPIFSRWGALSGLPSILPGRVWRRPARCTAFLLKNWSAS